LRRATALAGAMLLVALASAPALAAGASGGTGTSNGGNGGDDMLANFTGRSANTMSSPSSRHRTMYR